jgi:hypothetical protein
MIKFELGVIIGLLIIIITVLRNILDDLGGE